MSNLSLGVVFTSGRLEVWKIDKNKIDSKCHQEQISLVDTDTFSRQFHKAVVELGLSQEGISRIETFGVYVPDNLKKAAICGITRDGSLRAGEKLSRFLLFSPEVFYVGGDFNNLVKDTVCDVVVISGGFDDSDDTKIRKLISDIAGSEWFKKTKPKVIYAGNRKSVSAAQLSFSPLTDFYEIENILEGCLLKNDRSSLGKLDLCEGIPFNIKCSNSGKMMFSSCQRSLYSLSGYFCGVSSGRVVTALINDNYSILNQCRFQAGKTVSENIAVSKNADDICPDDFSNFYTEFLAQNNTVIDDIFMAEDVLAIGKRKSKVFFRPDRVIGISLSKKVDTLRFLDLISDPDIVRGIVEYYFDDTGFFLMCGAILNSNFSVNKEKVDKLIEKHDVSSGWLIIPDGNFEKDAIALEVYIGSDENDKTSKLSWGKRYTIPVKENSDIELRFKGSAFLFNRDPVVVLRAGNRPGNLVVDIRKEKS